MMDRRIGFVGDSLVNGTGDPTCLGWAGRLCCQQLQRGHALTYYNLGVRGQTSQQIEQRWQREVACRLPANSQGYVVFSFGVNDTTLAAGRLRVAPQETLAATARLLTTAKTRYSTLMIGPPAIADAEQNQRLAALSEQLAQVCQTVAVPYLEIYTATARSPVWLAELQAGDGAHPGAAGYSELAQLISHWSAWQAWFES
ncbi:GDSL-type esterase/lipase family protein [Almyronema epifaneia]|uniref:GDSL-type esterase/lipase family protein n=1 Tax=Almyronema epifaneia S1 TaxID=2991925 RepID=A0ABW6IA20_9CYAN